MVSAAGRQTVQVQREVREGEEVSVVEGVEVNRLYCLRFGPGLLAFICIEKALQKRGVQAWSGPWSWTRGFNAWVWNWGLPYDTRRRPGYRDVWLIPTPLQYLTEYTMRWIALANCLRCFHHVFCCRLEYLVQIVAIRGPGRAYNWHLVGSFMLYGSNVIVSHLRAFLASGCAIWRCWSQGNHRPTTKSGSLHFGWYGTRRLPSRRWQFWKTFRKRAEISHAPARNGALDPRQ